MCLLLTAKVPKPITHVSTTSILTPSNTFIVLLAEKGLTPKNSRCTTTADDLHAQICSDLKTNEDFEENSELQKE